MGLRFWKNEEEFFWPIRKVITNHALLHFPQKTHYSVEDFRFPTLYSRSIDHQKETAPSILREIMNYTDIGIEIGDLLPGTGFSQLLTAVNGDPSSIYKPDTILFTSRQLRNLPQAAFSIMAPHVRFSIQTDAKKQAKAEKNYLEKYMVGKFRSLSGVPVFSYDFTEELFEHFLSRTVLRHGKNFQLDLLGTNQVKGHYEDQFIQTFAEFAPEEFAMWQAGKIRLCLVEHLLVWVQLKKQLKIEGFSIGTGSGEPSKLFLQIPARKPKSSSFFSKKGNSKIALVEVLPQSDNNPTFVAYINQDYLRPFTFKKDTKTGKIIYTLAKEGSIELSGLKKIYDYFFQYERFPFFKKGKYEPTPLLDKLHEKDGDGEIEAIYIIPHKDVVFKLITESDIH